MTLVEIRKQFVKISGRYDLVIDTTDWADGGADFYLQAGQNYLDRLLNTPKSESSYYEALSAGDWYLTFQKCRSIREVWINNSEGRSKLDKKSMTWLYKEFAGLISATDNGTPLYYCPAKLRTQNDTDRESLGIFFNYVADDSDHLRGVLIFGPPDESIVVEVKGLFYSTELTADATESYWTLNWPETLVKAAMQQIAIFQRDHQDALGWKSAISEDLMGIDKDTVDEGISGVNQIVG